MRLILMMLGFSVLECQAFQFESQLELPGETQRLVSWVGAWEGVGMASPTERLHQVLVIEREKSAYRAELYQFRFPKDAIPLATQAPAIEGHRLQLSLQGIPAQFKAVLDRQSGILTGHWVWKGTPLPDFSWRPIALRNINRIRYPLGKPPGKKNRLRYQVPREAETGLPTRTLAAAALKWEPMQSFLVQAANGAWGRIHGILIAHEGYLVLEQYFYGFTKDDLHEIRSVQKSLVALEIMKLLEAGMVEDPQQPVAAYLTADQAAIWHATGNSGISLHQLLTMTSGLDASAYGDEALMQNRSGDYVDYMLRAPLVRQPGEAFEYHSGAMNLLVAVAENAGGAPFASLLEQHFWKPMSISQTHFYHDPSGRFYGAGGGAMRPRDVLKVGLLIANRGSFAGTQVLKPASLALMLADQAPELPWKEQALSYGYLWYRREYLLGGQPVLTYQARGAGGQVLSIIPDWQLVWLMTGGNYLEIRTMQDATQAFMAALWQARKP